MDHDDRRRPIPARAVLNLFEVAAQNTAVPTGAHSSS
jgi:hypothetical protein